MSERKSHTHKRSVSSQEAPRRKTLKEDKTKKEKDEKPLQNKDKKPKGVGVSALRKELSKMSREEKRRTENTNSVNRDKIERPVASVKKEGKQQQQPQQPVAVDEEVEEEKVAEKVNQEDEGGDKKDKSTEEEEVQGREERVEVNKPKKKQEAIQRPAQVYSRPPTPRPSPNCSSASISTSPSKKSMATYPSPNQAKGWWFGVAALVTLLVVSGVVYTKYSRGGK